MLEVRYEGWFQCRMATDPDPTDEPRGVSGTAFALVGEPDFDRVIRLQGSVALRMFGPPICVRVTTVLVDDQTIPGHPLTGARVELLDGAEFVEQNGIVVAPNTAFIDPFHLRVSQGDGIVLSRAADWDPLNPGLSYYDMPPGNLQPRQVLKLEVNVPEVLADSGLGDPHAFVDARKSVLEKALASERDEIVRAGHQQRLDALNLDDWRATRLYVLLAGRVSYEFDLNSTSAVVRDASGSLNKTVRADVPWPVQFWMGAWDNDALCGFMKGNLLIPLAETRDA